jgi:three-Cys-motif partner protein
MCATLLTKELPDDGLPTPEIGTWSEEKYKLVTNYATLFTTAMRGKWDELVYLDLFAGAGRSRVKETQRILPGSPLIALDLPHCFNRYVFCEKNRRLMAALKQRVSRDYAGAHVRFVDGDVNDKVPEIETHLPIAGLDHRVLTLCLVDPFSMSNLRFETIRRLARRYVDFLTLIPTGYDATRNEGRYLSPSFQIVDRFLGNPFWREEWAAARGRRETFDVFVANAFGHSMKQLGYKYEGVHYSYLVRLPGRRVRLYRLVLFSRSELGEKFWKESKKYTTDQRTLF